MGKEALRMAAELDEIVTDVEKHPCRLRYSEVQEKTRQKEFVEIHSNT